MNRAEGIGNVEQADAGSLGGGKPGGRHLTVGQWLAMFVLAFFVGPLCISNLWGYLQTRRYLTEAAFRNIRNVAALEATETLEFVRSARNLVPSIVAGNRHLFELLRSLAGEADADTRRVLVDELETHLAAKAREDPSVDEFQVMSPAGELLASSAAGPPAGGDLSAGLCFRRGRSESTIAGFDYGNHEPGHHSHTSPSHETEQPILLVTAPIVDEGGDFLGIFCARFRFEIHRLLLIAQAERTDQASLYLLDENGRIVCGSFNEGTDAPYGERLPNLGASVLGLGKSWEGRLHLDSGREILAAYAPIPTLDWGMVVEVPVARALADLERLKWQALVASVILAAILGGAVVISWRMIVRPLQALSRASDRMAFGVPGETVEARGPREIRDLASAFNRMSLALRDSQENLESRISDRTLELRNSQEFSELLLDSIDQRVVVLDSACRIVKANSAAIRMHGPEIIGESCCQAFEGLARLASSCPARATIETGRPVSAERSQRTLRGAEVVYVETYPILNPQGRVESVVEIGRIVTAEKKLQMQMVYQEKMAAFGQLAAGIAHEIGNPLASIQSQLQLAQSETGRVDETFGVVRKQVERIHRLLRELVGFTRRKRDEVFLVSVNQLVQDVTRLLEHDPRARTIRIDQRLADDLPGVRTREDALVQVLLNLGLNALDATPESGSVEFSTGVENGGVAVRVKDVGCGIPAEVQGQLFEPFFTTKPPGQGTGLGLFVSRAVVEEIGGHLDLEHTGPDGTEFVVRLPVDSSQSSGTGA